MSRSHIDIHEHDKFYFDDAVCIAVSYYETELAKHQAELARLENDNSAEAHARRITLLDNMGGILGDYANAVEQYGQSGHELRRAGDAMKSHAREQAQDFLRIIATGST